MRNKSIISKEIVELSEIRSAYNHYLASHRGLTEVENTTQIKINKIIASASLYKLYAELMLTNKGSLGFIERQVKPKTVQYSELEKNAILHFNNDKRFTITE
jgi:hypothetical protein